PFTQTCRFASEFHIMQHILFLCPSSLCSLLHSLLLNLSHSIGHTRTHTHSHTHTHTHTHTHSTAPSRVTRVNLWLEVTVGWPPLSLRKSARPNQPKHLKSDFS